MTLVGLSRKGREVRLSEYDRARHVHVLGASGYGKSRLLESMIRQDILARRGLCLIDPHGTLADPIVEFCCTRGIEKARPVHVIDLANDDWPVGFNPLRMDGFSTPQVRVDAMVSACAQVWGGEDLNATPLLKKCLRAIFFALCIHKLTLVEAIELVSATGDIRDQLTTSLPDPLFAALWRDFRSLSRREYAEQFASSANRLVEFLSSPTIRRIVGQREHVLDLKRAMDEGHVIIVNLRRGGTVSPDNARLLGSLIASELFLLAPTREAEIARRHPFYLYIDECYDYLSKDITDMLDQTRKFGLHVVLSHQRLGQLRARSEDIFNGVMAGGQTKIVMGGLEDEDAEVMAKQILRGWVNLERPKRILDKPIVVGEEPFWLESESEGVSTTAASTSSDTSGTSLSSGSSSGASESYRFVGGFMQTNPDSASDSVGAFAGTAASRSSGHATSAGRGESTTRGRTQTLRPIRVTLPTAVYSLEEEMHLAIMKLRQLPVQSAIVRRPSRAAVRVQVPDVGPVLASPSMVGRFEARSRDRSGSFSSRAAADKEIASREASLRIRIPVAADAQFWHLDE